ncbi:MAG: hypothetical protein HUJ91_02715 [Bacteroidales bacterium]|nr:hypothetical protein [Bacteroidales bacterium]
MRERVGIFLLTLLAVAGLPSCILENREDCRCFLHIDLSGVDSGRVAKMNLWIDGADNGYQEKMVVDCSDYDKDIVLKVDRRTSLLYAWGNINSSALYDDMRQLYVADAADSLWSFSELLDCSGDETRVTVVPRRQYVPVTVYVRGDLTDISDVKVWFSRSDKAFNYNSSVVESSGTMEASAVAFPGDAGGYWQFELNYPRQAAAEEAMLNLGFTKGGGTVLQNYTIGAMLKSEGVDLSETDLDPIVIDFTIGRTSVIIKVAVEDWVAQYTREIIM